MNQKQLWDKLAKENSRYYINSDYGRGITEEEFRKSGGIDYVNHLAGDELIAKRFEPSKRVLLEIGCGSGRMTEFMAYDFKKVIGADISGEMIKQGRKRLKRFDNVELVETNGETLPLLRNSVDIVFSYLVFQHMKTRYMVESNFKEVYRVLKPGGLLKVRVRADKLDSMDPWWAGVSCDEGFALSIGFKLLKKEKVKNYGLWLWLEK
jgi:ubiquinone/menaquinone biosynthesis C-methylase UbiE